jgi:hypothetical protein
MENSFTKSCDDQVKAYIIEIDTLINKVIQEMISNKKLVQTFFESTK